jgi:hypothetical protein
MIVEVGSLLSLSDSMICDRKIRTAKIVWIQKGSFQQERE